MWHATPGALQDLGRARRFSARGEQAPGNSRSRNKIRCEAVRLKCKVQRPLRIALLGSLCLRGKQYRAAPVRLRPVEVAIFARDGERLQRARPVALAALQIE